MAYSFSIFSEFNNFRLTTRDITQDPDTGQTRNNKLFQYKCITEDVDENEPVAPTKDTGAVWVTVLDPSTLNTGTPLYNTFSKGFLAVTGTILGNAPAGTNPKAEVGAITFYPS